MALNFNQPRLATNLTSGAFEVADLRLAEVNVTPSVEEQEIVPTAPVEGYNKVNVAAVDATIDENIVASNIKKDVEILGVTGTYNPQPNLEEKTIEVTSTAEPIEVVPSEGYDGISKITITFNI